MGGKVIEIAVKALAGGSAAPSVALGSLLVTAGFSGTHDVAAAARGMAAGAVGFTVYRLTAGARSAGLEQFA
jgi:hypothetical protein